MVPISNCHGRYHGVAKEQMNGARRKAVLVVIAGDQFVRNYLTSDAFDALENSFSCYYVGSTDITLKECIETKSRFLGFYQYDPDIRKRHYQLFDALMWGLRHKSSSFRFRAMRTTMRETPLEFQKRRDVGALLNALRYCRHLLRVSSPWFKKLKYRVTASRLVLPIYMRIVTRTLPVNPFLLSVVSTLKPEMVILPSSAYNPEGNDLARICTRLHIPCLFLVDNWDNLSSKSVLWAKPSHMGVWGEQSVEHAVEIQGMSRSQVTALGTPRFDQYFRLRGETLKPHFEYRYILFVGTALEFDEVGALTLINQVIRDNEQVFGGVKLVYRPHPQRQGSGSIIGKTLEHVIIDPQVYEPYAQGNAGYDVQPDLSYYPSLLGNAEIVIGGLTSMVIETLIFRRKYLALVYDDGMNITSQHNALKYYVHFRGLEDIDTVVMCDDMGQLPRLLISTWQTRGEVDVQEVDRQRMYYLHDEPTPYRDRLARLAHTILNGGS